MKTLFFVMSFMCIVLSRKRRRDDKKIDRDNPMEYALPLQLPDQNQDGSSDNHDFQKAFMGLHLTRYEISQLFEVVDRNRDGKIQQEEWSEFYNTFIQPFEAAQTSPRDGLIYEDGLTKTLDDLPTIKQLIENEEDKEYLQKIMQTLTSRIELTLSEKKVGLNINEYVFFRRASIAWEQCTQQKNFITKSSMQTCAQSIMLPNVHFSENQQQSFFWAIRSLSRPSEIVSDMFKFLTFLSSFHKYDMFKRIGSNKINSGVLNYNELKQASTDSEGPSQKLNLKVLETVFGKEHKNLEFTGLDYKQFYMLMQSIDFIYIYGKKDNTYIDQEEFSGMLDSKIWLDEYVTNIDDIKNDVKEEDEKPDAKSLWNEQKFLSQTYKMRRNKRHNRVNRNFRFIQRQKRFKNKFRREDDAKKTQEKNEIARNVTFNIFDLGQDGKWNGGELFLFHKFSFIFQSFVKGNIHLIYQKNLDFDQTVQNRLYDIPFFKEEQAQFVSFQRFLRDQSKYFEMAINFIQFTSSFYYKHHFMQNGQQSLISNTTPYPSFVRILNYLGMEIHKEDIQNAIEYKDKSPPSFLPAQKFNLDAYKQDGAQVNFEVAYHKSLIRWSKSFMRKKFFEGNERKKTRRS